MPSAAPRTAPTGRTAFRSTVPDQAISYLNEAYKTTLRVSGARDGLLWQHTRHGAGSIAIDDLRLPLTLEAQQAPLDSLVIAEVRAGRWERECAGVSERFALGEVFVDAEPGLPAIQRVFEARLQTVMLDLAVLARVAATAPARTPGPVRLTGYRPVSPAAAQHWRHTVNYLDEVLANEFAIAQPLIRANAEQMLAVAVLTTFPNSALIDPTATDRHDATAATVRRAVEFMESGAHTDITLVDIAAAANVSIRTIQCAFRRHLDTTPMAHLRAIRLHHVHEELRVADPSSGDTVTDIATRWGFYSHSRFAARYHRTYGVNPSRTLRAPG